MAVRKKAVKKKVARKKVVKKKATKKKTGKKTPSSITTQATENKELAVSPEGMEIIWDEECATVWATLKQEHRDVFILWMQNGYNGFEAVKEVYKYGESEREKGLAYVQSSRLLNSVKIMKLRTKLGQSTSWELQTARQVFIDAMRYGTYGEKIAGAKAHIDMLDRLNGTKKEEPVGTVNNIQNNNLIILGERLDSIRDLLNTPYLEGESKNK